MSRDISLSAAVAAFPDRISTTDVMGSIQRATGVFGISGRQALSPETTFTWAEIYLEMAMQGFEPCTVQGNTGQVPGYKRD